MEFVYFIVLVGVLISVHELGHFACAKFFGVRVLRFSLGFGPRIAGFRRGETEYVVAAIPLGGYVRMLGENPLDEVDPRENDASFASQNLLKRTVIVVAGPAMNLLFPILLYFVVFLGDTSLTPSIIGTVLPGRPADGKLLPGDRVVSVDGEPVETFYGMARVVGERAGRALEFELLRDGKRIERTITPVLEREERPLDRVDRVGRIGVMPHRPEAVIGVMSPSSPAAAARLQTFDRIVAAGGRPVHTWLELEEALEGNSGSMTPLTYLRLQPIPDAMGGLAELDVYEPRVATLTPEPGEGNGLERAGLEPSELYVSRVAAGSPEHRMGLLPGDRLLELDGRPIQSWKTFLEDLKAGRGNSHTLTWRRGGHVYHGRYSLEHKRGVTEHGQVYDRYVVGIQNWMPTSLAPSVSNPDPIAYAASEAVRSTAEVVELTVFSVVRLLQGRLTVKSIGGPLTIFEVAGTAAREGALNYLTLMAFISINLGLLNLLPIPLLDGGHLLFFLIEAVARRPLSVRMREYASLVGLAVLVLLMVLAFKNDIERQWPHIIDEISAG